MRGSPPPHLRCLIGTNCVLVLNNEQELVAPFVGELSGRLHNHWERMNDPLEGSDDIAYELATIGEGGAVVPREPSLPLPLQIHWPLTSEVLLETVAKHEAAAASDLENQAHSALNALTSKVRCVVYVGSRGYIHRPAAPRSARIVYKAP